MRKILIIAIVILIIIGIGGIMSMNNTHQVRSVGDSGNLLLAEDLREILKAGAMAPSSHNTQMWKVMAHSNREITIMLDESRLLPEADSHKSEAYTSLGTFIENIVQAAPCYGLNAEVVIPDNIDDDGTAARIAFRDHPTINKETPSTLESINKRHTVRTAYNTDKLSTHDIKGLQEAGGGKLYYYPVSSTEGEFVKNIHITAVQKQAEDEELQQELADWVRYNKKEADEKGDGLNPQTMGLSFIKQQLFYIFVNRDNFTSDTSIQSGIDMAKDQAENSAGFIIIVGDTTTPSGMIEVGRVMERVWLKAAEMDVALQPLYASLEEDELRQEINTTLDIAEPVQSIMRVGYVNEYGKAMSKRRPLDEFVFLSSDFNQE